MLVVLLASCGGHGSGGAAATGGSGGTSPTGGSGGLSPRDAGSTPQGSGGAAGGGQASGGSHDAAGGQAGGLPPATGGGGGQAHAGGAGNGGGAAGGAAGHGPRDAGADTGTVVATDASNFTMYPANAAHTDFIEDDTLVPPLRRLWKVSLDTPIFSSPLVVGDRIFASTSPTDAKPARLLAFDRLTGSPLWSTDLPTSSYVNLAYENGRVFAVDNDGAVDSLTSVVVAAPFIRAFDAATGAVDWQIQGDLKQPFQLAAPVAVNGTLYVTASGSAALPTLHAYDETSGHEQWKNAFDDGSFAVSADGFFTYDACGNVTALDISGGTRWAAPDAGGCYPGGTSVLFDHTLYETPERVSSARVDTRTGMKLGPFAGDRLTPAFGHGLEVDPVGPTLQASSIATGAKAWTFTSEGDLAVSPLIVGGTVYMASRIGTVYAIDAATGQVSWSEDTGDTVPSGGLFGIAAAHGVLVVPTMTQLIAYGPAGPTSDAGTHDYGGKTPCPWSLVHAAPAVGADQPTGIAIADFNKDGKRDIAVSSWGSFGGGGVNVSLGKGDGSFDQLIEQWAFGDGTHALAAADLDGDGKPDVVSASSIAATDGQPNLQVILGKGDGTFLKPTYYTVGTAPNGIVLADLDGNGRIDVVVADAADGFRVLFNQGKGVLGKPVAYGAGQQALAIALADLNGDGKSDIVLATKDPPNAIQVFPGKGNGTFGAALVAKLDAWPAGLALGDVNGDGKLDVVVATGDVEILIGKGDGTFAAPVTMQAGTGVSGVALGDVDLDGRLDLVVTNSYPSDARIFFGNGDGTFTGMETFATTLEPILPTITDLNGDGLPDIVTVDTLGDVASVLLGACGGGR
jgi:outer membrane protein assembly factor BamB